MNQKNHFLCFVLVLVVFITAALPISAAGSSLGGTTIMKNSTVSTKEDHEEVVEYRDLLEERHGIKIRDVSRFFQADNIDDPTYVLRALNNTLYKMPRGLLDEMTSYYKAQGMPTTVRVGYKDGKYIMDGTFELTGTGPVVTIYHTPFGWAGTSSQEGGYDAYLTVAHEFGHYVQHYLWDVYGKDKLRNEWRQIARNYPYGNWKNGYDEAFTREYAATSYEEDFADVFGYMVAHPEELARRIEGNPDSVLAKKVALMEKVVSKAFETDLDLSGWREIYGGEEEVKVVEPQQVQQNEPSSKQQAEDGEDREPRQPQEDTSQQTEDGEDREPRQIQEDASSKRRKSGADEDQGPESTPFDESDAEVVEVIGTSAVSQSPSKSARSQTSVNSSSHANPRKRSGTALQ